MRDSNSSIEVFAAEVGHPAVGVNYDTGNVAYLGLDPTADVADALPSVGHVHLKDQRGGPESFDFPALGEGGVDLAGFLGALAAAGFGDPAGAEARVGQHAAQLPPDAHGLEGRQVLEAPVFLDQRQERRRIVGLRAADDGRHNESAQRSNSRAVRLPTGAARPRWNERLPAMWM